MTSAAFSATADLERDGFAILRRAFSPSAVAGILERWSLALEDSDAEQVRTSRGQVYAARDVLGWWPGAAEVWRNPVTEAALADVLGTDFGLVRVLFFDKPPDRTWTLPWHKDLTVAVREHPLRRDAFSKPTVKAGLPHLEAPLDVLERMLTARLHLDDATDENGPLQVIPGSHRTGKELRLDSPPTTILAEAGDVLLMRPLIAHASGRSHEGTRRHRRILHFEFASAGPLPDDCEWNAFIR